MPNPMDDDAIDCGNGISVGGQTEIGRAPEGVFDALAEAAYENMIANEPPDSEPPPGAFPASEID